MSRPFTDIRLRFAPKHTAPETGCWEWLAAKNPGGYGLVRHNNKSSLAHRVSYELHVASIPEGDFDLMHTCDNPGCVNPAHLELCVQVHNMVDHARKGGALRAQMKRADLKLTPEAVKEIRLLLAKKIPHRTIAAQYGISYSSVFRISKGILWSSVV
jgi:hypothetical protein